MLLLERNSLVTIAPKFSQDYGKDARFRWTMHVSLPFPFPIAKIFTKSATIGGHKYKLAIMNQTDRLTISHVENKCIHRVFLHPRAKPLPKPDEGFSFDRELLQSVVVFTEAEEFSTPDEAFSIASEKVQACFNYLTEFLANLQANVPYLTTWLLYPISLFDVGTIFHSAEKYCNTHVTWHTFASAPAINMARSLQHPLFLINFEENGIEEESIPSVGVANELLAEAQMSLFRGMTRLTILNSYLAVETFANSVFTRLHNRMLIDNQVPEELASTLTEEKRQRNKTDPKFLLHRGIKEIVGRSLMDEDKKMYDGILKLQECRHQVAHAGIKPETEYAREKHSLSCECVRWLAGVANLPVKPMLPDQDAIIPGISTTSKDAHAISSAEYEFIRHALGYSEPLQDDK